MTESSETERREDVVFVPLGGTGEIGMNMNLYGYGLPGNRDWIMVDAGVMFGDEREPGIDVILPDTRFIEQHKKRLKGLVLTHGHEDHIGAVAYLWPRLRCPVFATPFTAELVRGKLLEAGLEDQVELNILPLNSQITLGPFDIDLIGLTHSIAEPCALAIRTPVGNLLHTGDWKIDPAPQIGKVTDVEKLKAFGEEGIEAIICDSTNVLSPGTSGSESLVAESLAETVKHCKGRVVITTFASNVARLSAIGKAASKNDRHITMLGRGMFRIFNAAQKTGYLKDFPSLVDEQEEGFDLICCLEMLEHVPDPASTVAACAKLLRPGGSIFFSTINRNLKAFLFAIVGAEYILSLLPRGTHDYKKFIRPAELDSWARRASLSMADITGMHYNPLSKRYTLGDGVAVNYISHYLQGTSS